MANTRRKVNEPTVWASVVSATAQVGRLVVELVRWWTHT